MNQSTHNSFHERLHQTDQNLEGQFPCEATNAGAENDVPDVFNDNQLVYRPVWSPLTPLQFRVGPVGPPTGGAEQLDATQLFPNPEETFYSDEAESLYRTGV
jgi:hypothetical protein